MEATRATVSQLYEPVGQAKQALAMLLLNCHHSKRLWSLHSMHALVLDCDRDLVACSSTTHKLL